jgi:transcriptional regulator with XRE-family HTH domain
MAARQDEGETPGGDSPAGDEQMRLARAQQVGLIGKKIRALRRDHMTLAQLAQASSVSIGVLSRLENGIGNPHFSALSAIARALNVHVSTFFEPPANGGTMLTGADRVKLQEPQTGVEMELLVPDFHARIIGMIVTLPPGFRPGRQARGRPGQQFELVLEGSVEFRIEHEIHELAHGDAIFFNAARPHSRKNMSGSDRAVLLSCATEAQLESYFSPDSGTP